jgi:hypothetical protein
MSALRSAREMLMRPALLITRCHLCGALRGERVQRPTHGAGGLRMPQQRRDLSVAGDLAAGNLLHDAIDALEETRLHGYLTARGSETATCCHDWYASRAADAAGKLSAGP